MKTVANDRRTRRSLQTHEALSLQLERVRDQASLDALVLATAEGLPVAHSGETTLCEELAAMAPLFPQKSQLSEQTREARAVRRVQPLTVSRTPLYLVFYAREQPRALEQWVEHTQRGVTRILDA